MKYTSKLIAFLLYELDTSGGARGWQEGAEPHPERFEPPLESFETRIEIRKSYVMSAFLGAQSPPEYFLGAEPPLELFSGSATASRFYSKIFIIKIMQM